MSRDFGTNKLKPCDTLNYWKADGLDTAPRFFVNFFSSAFPLIGGLNLGNFIPSQLVHLFDLARNSR